MANPLEREAPHQKAEWLWKACRAGAIPCMPDTHKVKMICQPKAYGQSARLVMNCPGGCKYRWFGSNHVPDSGENISKLVVTNQLIFGSTLAGLGIDQYRLLCHGLAIPPACETYYNNFRTKSLKSFEKFGKHSNP